MKELFFKIYIKTLIAPLIVFAFFLPNLLLVKLPVPADSLLGLYHPWRDNSYQDYSAYKFPIKNPLITDPIKQTYPWRQVSIHNIKNFKLPLWNPYSFSGQPLLANVQSATLQVLNIFYLVFPFKISWAIQIISQALLTSFFMYLFLKNRGLSFTASTFGAVTLAFSGFFVAWLTWGTVISVAMWLPLILFMVDKLTNKITTLPFFILTFALFQTFVSGHTQTAVYILLATILYSTLQMIKIKSFKFALFIFLSMVTALLLSAIQILPALEFVSFSNRQLDQSYWQGRQDWFLPLQNLAQLVAPDFFGNPATNNYWGTWNYAEFVSYVGIVPLFFAFIAIAKPNKNTVFFITLLTASFLLALENPVSKIPYVFKIPLISSFQPSRIIFLIVFTLTSLSAYGFEIFFRKKKKDLSLSISLLLTATIISLICFTKISANIFPNINGQSASQVAFRNLAVPLLLSSFTIIICLVSNSRNRRGFLIAIVFALSVFDLFRFAYKFTPFVKESLIFPGTKTTDYLQNQQRPFRVMTADRRIVDPNTLTAYRIESVSGYDPIYLKDYAVLVNSWQNDKVSDSASFNRIITPQNYQNQLTDLLNVKYLLSLEEIDNDRFKKLFEEGQTKIYENKNVLPRAFFPRQVKKIENEKQVLEKLMDKKTDISKIAYSQDIEFESQNLSTSAQIIKYSDQGLSIKTSTNIQAPLFISNVFYPGWKAFLDNREVPIGKMNYMFQSVNIPEGIHLLELKYQPKSFFVGLYLALFGLLSMSLISYYLWRKKFL